jgi:hypothetical protein
MIDGAFVRTQWTVTEQTRSIDDFLAMAAPPVLPGLYLLRLDHHHG